MSASDAAERSVATMKVLNTSGSLLLVGCPAIEEELHAPEEFITRRPKGVQPRTLVPRRLRRVGQPPVQSHGIAEEERADLLGAQGDNRVHRGGIDLLDRFRAVP